jgi:hypothetical protein
MGRLFSPFIDFIDLQVIAIVKTINFPWQNQISAVMAYVENPNDSSGTKYCPVK